MKEKELEILAARIESWPLNVGAASAGEPQLSPMGPVLLLVSVWFQKNNNVSNQSLAFGGKLYDKSLLRLVRLSCF